MDCFSIPQQVECDEPDLLKKSSKQQKLAFWKRTKRLSHGSLICLWWLTDNSPRPNIVFGVIGERNADDLAGPRPRLGIKSVIHSLLLILQEDVFRSIPRPYNEKLVSLLLKEKEDLQISEVVMLQAGPSFFAFEPILKALKTAPIPLAHIIAQPPQTVNPDGGRWPTELQF